MPFQNWVAVKKAISVFISRPSGIEHKKVESEAPVLNPTFHACKSTYRKHDTTCHSCREDEAAVEKGLNKNSTLQRLTERRALSPESPF
jgi:hypothetical protein